MNDSTQPPLVVDESAATTSVRLLLKSLTCSDSEAEVWGQLNQLSTQSSDLVLDMSSVGFLSSAALGKLIGLNRKLARKGGRVVLCGLDKEVESVFRVTRLDRILLICASVEDAFHLLNKENKA